jgi:membrane-associated phospholipid phosphatase
MILTSRINLVLLFLSISYVLNGQISAKNDSLQNIKPHNLKFKTNQLIIPAALFTYGIIAIESDYLKLVNIELRDELKESIDEKVTIDDFTQYAPAVSVYALNNLGIKGKNNLRDRTIILGTSYLLMGSSVYALKNITKIERPDGSSNNSFPSGHTATAFAGAEFLWQEYKDVNIWYGITGYAVATGTGLFRIYNARHWLSDVVMGAGIGILTTKIAYWIFPYVDNHIFKSNKKVLSTMIAPFYNGNQIGIGMLINLK